VNASPHPRLTELFVRYWDNALTPAEANEFAKLLADDSTARDWFQFLTMQAVAAAELPAVAFPTFEEKPGALARSYSSQRTPNESRQWSRRRMLGLLGGGLAAGLGTFAIGRWFWNDRVEKLPQTQVQITGVQGIATVRTADGRALSANGPVPSGATVSTQGLGSTAILTYPDGSTVSLLNDSAITVHESGQLLLLHQGMASAVLRPRVDDKRLTLTTALLTLSRVNDTSITVGQGVRSTEIEVHHGSISVSAPTGEPMTVVREGELLTVGSNGVRTQQPIPVTPEEFAWNLTNPLPEGWAVGRREVVGDTPVVRCEAWPDPYYDRAIMYQIRSDSQWGRGLFRLTEGSIIHVRYRAKLSSPKGQVCFCTRTMQSRCSDTGMLEYNGGFEAGEWRWLHIPAASMLANKHAPSFGAPWVAFLIIFNTFEADVGLEIAEFRVTPPGK
jgi:ferric-dicitrate binding protein FerR (iron transport regulator)